jgi:hypothetical protein
MLTSQELVTIARFTNPFEAHLAAGLLHNQGIPSIIADDSTSLNQLHPIFTPSAGIRVRVRAQDAEEARRVLSEIGDLNDEALSEVAEEPEEAEDTQKSAVCPLCASPGLQQRKRWWVAPMIVLPLGLLPVRPVAAVAFSVALLIVSWLLPRTYTCAKCRNVVTVKK